MTKFTLADAIRANEEWGCNCGPGALAAIMGMTLDEVRPHIPGFDTRRYTNPSMMNGALANIGRPWRKAGAVWPAYGLVRLQWEGPWTEPGVPMAARYRYTHWVGSWISPERGHGIFDINCMNNGTGWALRADWEREIVPAITAQYKSASGAWHVTHALSIERGSAPAAVPPQ
jgi:hypothetical protein